MTATRSSDVAELTEAIGAGTPVTSAAGAHRAGLPNWLGGLIGTVVLAIVWEVLVLTHFHSANSGVPRPNRVVTQFWDDWRSGLYGRNIGQTLKEAATGYVVANVLAIAFGIAFIQVPLVEKALLRIAIASYCLPIIAIGPILTFVLHGDAPKSALAGLLVFFPSLIGVLVGLRSADRAALDLVWAAGGGSWAQLTKVRLRAALPSTFAALQIAAPSAILGAIIGEYLGAQTSGLGVMMIVAQEAAATERLWGIALLCTAIAGACYAAVGFVTGVVTPWAPRRRSL